MRAPVMDVTRGAGFAVTRGAGSGVTLHRPPARRVTASPSSGFDTMDPT
ncbi:MAG: hypothetical protein LBR33_00930 [Propionibacteriaceae bacterium]|jgi:hypothetical protein|nr:hypothetical protein [Propionibacteriaceae bacterium]